MTVLVLSYSIFPSTFRGVLVPGGFGSRGSEGKVLAAKWARENKKPYLGNFQLFILINFFMDKCFRN